MSLVFSLLPNFKLTDPLFEYGHSALWVSFSLFKDAIIVIVGHWFILYLSLAWLFVVLAELELIHCFVVCWIWLVASVDS